MFNFGNTPFWKLIQLLVICNTGNMFEFFFSESRGDIWRFVLNLWCLFQKKVSMLSWRQDKFLFRIRGHRGHDHMVVGFTTTNVISAYHHYKVVSSNPAHGKVYSIQHNVIKFVSDLRQDSGSPRVLWFPPWIELTTTI
jgi:hypothetical protein